MKAKYNEYIKLLMYIVFGILLIISSYIIIININHYKSLNNSVTVSEADSKYSKYKDNVNIISDKVNSKINKDNEAYEALLVTINSMQKDGVFRLIPKEKLSNSDLYKINDYFMEELINNNWVSYLKELSVSVKYQDIITMLVSNSNYINSVLINNSLILSDGSLDNKIEDNYHMILNNYLMYSNVILDICNDIGGEYE